MRRGKLSSIRFTITTGPGKEIVREARDDWAMYYNGLYIGARATRSEATDALDSYVYDLLKRQPTAA